MQRLICGWDFQPSDFSELGSSGPCVLGGPLGVAAAMILKAEGDRFGRKREIWVSREALDAIGAGFLCPDGQEEIRFYGMAGVVGDIYAEGSRVR